MRIDGYPPIGDYGVVGDGRTAGLISSDGALEWLCLPSLQSPSVFAAALDAPRGGRFELAPEPPFETVRRYMPRTNVLETCFRGPGGAARVTEAFTLDDGTPPPWRELVRRVEGLEGSLPFRWRVEPRFDYGRSAARFTRTGRAVVADANACRLGLLAWDAGEPQLADDGSAVWGAFEARVGSRATLALVGDRPVPLRLPSRDAAERRLDGTVEDWRRWLRRGSYRGDWSEAVERSLLALRLLQDPESGVLAAAATSSLPEVVGGERNLDYRYGWVRDIAFALEALQRLGFDEDAHRAYRWLVGATAGSHPRPTPLYALDGSSAPPPSELPLAGYRGSRPVRAGNQAVSQLQLAAWGELLEATWMQVEHSGVLDAATGARLADLVDVLSAIWRRPDCGLWELPDRAQYASSKIGCWVAFDRALKLADRGRLPRRHVARWRSELGAVRRFVDERLWSPERRTFLMEEGSEALDCANLLAARRGFVDPTGDRLAGTIAAVQHELSAGGSFLYRYSGMREQENAFAACSFWLVEALALARRFDEAASLMDDLVGRAGPLGLWSEQVEPESGELAGNYPQALTHLSVLNAAALYEESLAETAASQPSRREAKSETSRATSPGRA